MPPRGSVAMSEDSAESPTPQTTSLWEQAFNSLKDKRKKELASVSNGPPLNPDSILQVIAQKKESCRNRWAVKLYKKKSGEEVTLLDILDHVSRWVKQFVQIGDTAVQFDKSGHAAIPWMAVKALLQLTIHDFDTYGSLVEGVETVSRIIAVYPEPALTFESIRAKQLSASLLKLYTALLAFLADAHHYFSRNPVGRIWHGLKSAVEDDPMKSIEKLEQDIFREQTLFNDDCSQKMQKDSAEQNQRIDARTARIDRDRIFGCINGIRTDEAFNTALLNQLPGTCAWALNLHELQLWESEDLSRAKVLWIYGPPGFGKTVLSAAITQHLQKTTGKPVAYFFCVADHQPTRDPYAILRSWLAQALETPKILDAMQARFSARTEGNVLTQAELWELFTIIGESFPGCIFIVDGFDECTDIDSGVGYHTHDPRNHFLRDLIKHLSQTRSRILIVSRDVPDIREHLGQEQVEAPEVDMHKYEITAADTAADIRSFSEAMVNKKLPKKPAEVQRKVAFQAAERSDGMFLWITLLEKQISPVQNAKELMATVREMPSGIDEAYARELERIMQLPPRHRSKAVMILRWVLFTLRPLEVKELVEALVVSDDDLEEEYPWDNLPDTWEDSFVDDEFVKERILGGCGSLLQLRASSSSSSLAIQTVHFVHFSVREYLLSTGGNSQANILCLADSASEELRLSKICLRYLALDVFKDTPTNIKLHPFLAYAGWAWYFHSFYRKLKPTPDILDQTWKIFDPTTSSRRLWAPILEDKYIGERQNGVDYLPGLGVAHLVNSGVLQRPLSSLQSLSGVHAPDPIYYACLLGLIDIVKWLADDHSQDTNCAGGRFGFPLQAAVAGSHIDVLRYLLHRDVAKKQNKGQFGTALAIAVAMATPEVVSELLNAGADANVGHKGEMPLEWAVRRNSSEIVEQLLSRGAKITSWVKYLACSPQSEAMLPKLLAHGAAFDVASNKQDARMVLEVIERLNSDTAVALVDSLPSAVIAAPVATGTTLLHSAVKADNLSLVKRLLHHPNVARRADVNCLEVDEIQPHTLSALHVACIHAKPEIVRALLNADAKVTCVGSYKTPLMLAASENRSDIIRILHEHGANLDENTGGVTALGEALEWGHYDAVCTLLELGAGLAGVFKESLTLFEMAVRDGRMDVAEMSVQCGCFAKPDGQRQPQEEHRLPAAVFLSFGDLEKVKTFLQHPTLSPETLDESLRLTAAQGYTSIATWLLDLGVRPITQDMNGRTALHYAAAAAHDTLADLLIERGAQSTIALEDISGLTPVELVIMRGTTVNAFIRKHSDSHIHRLSQLLKPQNRGSVSAGDVRVALAGTWKGHRRLDDGYKIKEGLILEFPAMDALNGDQSSYPVHTLVDPTGVIWFLHFSSESRSILQCMGQLDADLCTMRGSWGKNSKRWLGTFTLKKLTEEGEEKTEENDWNRRLRVDLKGGEETWTQNTSSHLE